LLLHYINEKLAEGVIAHFTDKGCVCAQTTGSHRHIGRRAARFGIKSSHIRQPPPDFSGKHVDEEFAQGCDVHGCSVIHDTVKG